VVENTRLAAGPLSELWSRAEQALSNGCAPTSMTVHTEPAGNAERIAEVVARERPDVVVAAGGDGTVRDAIQGIRDAGEPSPPLAIVPLGTANNVARSLGLESVRRGGRSALDRAVTAALAGADRRIDLGRVNGRWFVGSFALGMDADILRLRNRLVNAMRWASLLGGYPPYLASCAANLFRAHGGAMSLCCDGDEEHLVTYDLVVTNVPLYAGEFRFGPSGAFPDDGRLDLQRFANATDYVRRFTGAWMQQLRHDRGPSLAPAGSRTFTRLTVETTSPVAAQIDGEEIAPERSWVVSAAPGAVTVRLPRASSG
jgi:diacylglycerol kinase family enzyme